MESEEKKLDSQAKNIPRNPNRKITDDEINEILKDAAKQVAEKEDKKSGNEKQKNTGLDNKENGNKDLKNQKVKNNEQEKKNFNKNIEEKDSKQSGTQKKNQKKDEIPKKEQQNKKLENTDAGKRSLEKQKLDKKNPENKKIEDKSAAGKQIVNQKEIEELLDYEPIITRNTPQEENPYKEKVTVGRVIGIFFESIWTIFKLAVLVTIVTVVAGFLLSRDMMIRGRNGNRQCTQGMTVSANVPGNKSSEEEKVKKWLGTVTREKITLEADDNSILIARKIVINEESNKWAVVLHGYNGSMEDIYDIAMHYTEEGYNVLMPDLRAHGESEGSFLGMGWLDRLDVINWIDVIVKENASAEVVIHGIDIGADTALMLSGEPLKNNIKAIVAEGAYTSAWDVVKLEYKARHEKWPVFPLMNMMNPVMKVWTGYSLKEADAVKQVKNSKVPILLIHGENDTYATEDMTNQIEQAIASEHEMFTVATGSHEDCRYAEPDNYYNKTFEFIAKYVH